MNITKLKTRPKVFKRLFGISPQKFNQLVIDIEPLWKETELQRKQYKGRKNKVQTIGSGRPYRLNLEQNLAMLLLYYRTYVPHIVLAEMFHIHDSGVCRYFKKIQPIVSSLFDLHKEVINISPDEVLRLCVDATEQESEKRPGSGYSGKKKRQTIKVQATVDNTGKIHHISSSVPGNIHDKKLFDQSNIHFPKDISLLGDLGYLGTALIIPQKSSKLHKLTEKQKQENTNHSKLRIIIEHVFAHLKKFRILSARFRNNPQHHSMIFHTIAGIYNLKFE